MMTDGKRTGRHQVSDGAFYTLPSAAALLAGLSIPDDWVDWQDDDAVSSLRIMDPACGSGILLEAVRDKMVMMGASKAAATLTLHGLDIDADAIQQARDRLGIYDDRLKVMPHGIQEDGTARAGTLELLADWYGDQDDLFSFADRGLLK